MSYTILQFKNGLKDKNTHKKGLIMPVYYKEHDVRLFIHIPKSGGTTFEKVAKATGWKEHFKLTGMHVNNLGGFICSPQHYDQSILKVIFCQEKFNSVFTIVRNPYNRIKSEYYWQRKLGVTELCPAPWLEKVFKDYQKKDYIFDNHLRPQVEFIPKDARCTIYKLEENGIYECLQDLNCCQPIRQIQGKILLKLFGRYKKSTYDQCIENEFLKLSSNIRSFYRVDYERFGYSTTT